MINADTVVVKHRPVVVISQLNGHGEVTAKFMSKDMPGYINSSGAIHFKDVAGVDIRLSSNYIIDDFRKGKPDDYISLDERIELEVRKRNS